MGAPAEHTAGDLTWADVAGRLLGGRGIQTQRKEEAELARGEQGEFQMGCGVGVGTERSKVLRGQGAERSLVHLMSGGVGGEAVQALQGHLSTLVWTEVNSGLEEESRVRSSEHSPSARGPVSAGSHALPAILPPPWRLCPWAHQGCPGRRRLCPAPGLAASTEREGNIPVPTLQERTQADQEGGDTAVSSCSLPSIPSHLPGPLLPCPGLNRTPHLAH